MAHCAAIHSWSDRKIVCKTPEDSNIRECCMLAPNKLRHEFLYSFLNLLPSGTPRIDKIVVVGAGNFE
jgi:hypothetical protein